MHRDSTALRSAIYFKPGWHFLWQRHAVAKKLLENECRECCEPDGEPLDKHVPVLEHAKAQSNCALNGSHPVNFTVQSLYKTIMQLVQN